MTFEFLVLDHSNDPITGGAASTGIKILREVDNYLLDWNDGSFKNTGWTTLESTLAEIDDTNLAGMYQKDVAIGGWNDGRYLVSIKYVSGTIKKYGNLTIHVVDGKVIEEDIPLDLDIINGLVDQLELRLTSARASYLDNLNIATSVAAESTLTVMKGGGWTAESLKELGDRLISTLAYVDELESRMTAERAGNLDNLDVPVSDPVTVGTNNDKTGYSLSSAYEAVLVSAIWTATTRTLTLLGTLIVDIWAYASRTLTAGTKDTEIDAIKVKTDQLEFSVAGNVHADIEEDSLGLAKESTILLGVGDGTIIIPQPPVDGEPMDMYQRNHYANLTVGIVNTHLVLIAGDYDAYFVVMDRPEDDPLINKKGTINESEKKCMFDLTVQEMNLDYGEYRYLVNFIHKTDTAKSKTYTDGRFVVNVSGITDSS